ncbi:AAA family ATPase [Fusobacterium sp.]|uniref:AAA family ATPase n=1 Tax=Fusobacterium sp. TaxID=68766 RepID=UPI0029032DA8|nr:AAA family ATPase [Fusobacterium sp.]MDU1911753.1 AAA family ATPase [Fusobacterium sp.]
MNYKINKIILNNFKFISQNEKKEIKFNNKDLIILGGPNGFGKTTIFNGIELVLSGKISGIKGITKGNRYLNNHVCLNNSTKEGIIGIELKNSEKKLSIICKILKNNRNQEQDLFIERFYRVGELKKEDLENLELLELKRIEKISEISELKNFKEDYFNIFHYISQKEYAYYLEKNEEERKEIITQLIGIASEKGTLTFLRKFLGKSNAETLTNQIENKENEVKKMIKENIIEKNLEEFSEEYAEDEIEKFICKNEISLFLCVNQIEELKEKYQELKEKLLEYELFLLGEKFSNYNFKKKYEKKLKFFIENKNQILNNKLLKNYKIDEKGLLEAEKKNNEIEEIKKILQKPITKENFFELKIPERFVEDERLLKDKINIIITREESLNLHEKVLLKFKEIRRTLFEHYKSSNEIFLKNQCPLCGTELNSIDEAYSEITLMLEKDTSDIHLKELNDSVQCALKKIEEELIKTVNDEMNYKIEDINFINKNRINILNFFEFCQCENINEEYINLESFLGEKILKLKNEDFEKEYKNTKYIQYLDKIPEITKEIIIKERRYLEKSYIENKNRIISQNQKKITDEVIKILQLKKLQKKLNIIKEIYKERIEKFQKDIFPILEVPLYIYTGKILQDYQNGMGVFIQNNGNGIKFIPNINTEHDIINTFSSGQLSGFMVVLVMVMNKIYSKTENNIDSILIDDPFHTLDDVNITSLIEILRQSFFKKQIIISSHEDKKTDFMRYKFNKFNLLSEEINVREKFF